MPWIVLAITISYLIGSIPTAYIFGRIIKKTDIRKFGSGNVGATNALRLLGKGWGVTVLIIDILKGFVPVVLLGNIFAAKVNVPLDAFLLIVGVSAICGHNWTVFLGFKGGKGVATTLGALIGLSVKLASLRYILVLTILVWVTTFAVSKIISLSSILAAASFPVFSLFLTKSYALIFTGMILSAFIIFRHKENLKRIIRGTEPRLIFKKKQS